MDNLDFMNDFVNNSSYVWVPMVAFGVLILIAGAIGFWNGWKTSLYFLGWNVAGAVSGVFATSAIMGALDKVDILKIMSSSAESLWGILILFAYLLVVNFLAFLFYWIFRGKLKKSMKANKKAKKSNLSSRFIGMGIAVVSVSPMAVYLADASAVMSTENGYTKFLDKMVKAYTGGKYKGTSEDRILVGNLKSVTNLLSSFGNSKNLDDLNTEEAKKAIQDVLNTDFSKNIDTIYDNIKNTDMGKDINDADIKALDKGKVADNIPAMGIKLTKEKAKDLKESLVTIFASAGNAHSIEVANAIITQLTATK